VTVTLDNRPNWDNKHVVSCCYFLKMCCYRSRPVSIVAVKTLTFHKVVLRHTWGVVGSLVIVSLLIFSWFWQWNNFENWLMFDEVKAYKKWCQFYCANFLGHPVYQTVRPSAGPELFCPACSLFGPARLSAKLHYTDMLYNTTNGQAHNNSTTCCVQGGPKKRGHSTFPKYLENYWRQVNDFLHTSRQVYA